MCTTAAAFSSVLQAACTSHAGTRVGGPCVLAGKNGYELTLSEQLIVFAALLASHALLNVINLESTSASSSLGVERAADTVAT